MSLPLPDFGLTSWIDFTNDSEITADAQLRVSAVGDSLGLINDFTQGTDANKPRWSRSDNKENLIQYSEGAFNNTTYWTKASVAVADAAITVGGLSMSTITASAASAAHGIFSVTAASPTTVTGQSYEQSWLVKMGTHRYVQVAPFAGPFATTFFNFDLQDGVVGTNGGSGITGGIEVFDAANGVYRIWIRATGVIIAASGGLLYLVPSASATRLQSWVAAGTETVHITQCHYRNILTDPTYIPTTDHPQYAGVNGRKCLVFNGAQELVSTSLTSNIFANNAKLVYVLCVPFALVSTRVIFDSVGTYFSVRTLDDQFVFLNYDGNNDQAVKDSTVSLPYIVRGRHSGNRLYVATDTGAGFSAETGTADVASGNTTNVSTAIRIGSTTIGFYGKILGIATANTGAAKPNLENLLREYFFARSQLRWDPYLADLVLKRQ